MQSPADKRRQKALEQARHDLQAHLLAHIAAREHARETRDLATVAALRRAVRMWEDMHDTQKGGLITAGGCGGSGRLVSSQKMTCLLVGWWVLSWVGFCRIRRRRPRRSGWRTVSSMPRSTASSAWPV